jgi:2-methylcitrate dehydratase
LLDAKFRRNLARRFPEATQRAILGASAEPASFDAMPVHEYVDLYTT